MDAKSQQAEAQLQLLKKEQSAAEDFLQDLQRQQFFARFTTTTK